MNNIRAMIKSRQALYRYSNEDMAVLMHMSLSSWERRLAHPELIKLGELLKIGEILKIEFLRDEFPLAG